MLFRILPGAGVRTEHPKQYSADSDRIDAEQTRPSKLAFEYDKFRDGKAHSRQLAQPGVFPHLFKMSAI